MSAVNAAQAYLANSIMTATPEKLVDFLYDGAIRFIDQARVSIQGDDVAKAGTAFSRAFAVVSELRSSLDFEKGGEVSTELDRLYGFVQDRLVAANRSRDSEPLGEARNILVTLKEGWDGIARNSD